MCPALLGKKDVKCGDTDNVLAEEIKHHKVVGFAFVPKRKCRKKKENGNQGI